MSECWNSETGNLKLGPANASIPSFQRLPLGAAACARRDRHGDRDPLRHDADLLLRRFRCDRQSWRAGREMSNTMGQADYVIDQVVSRVALAYYPDLGKQDYKYGFQLISNGDDVSARDSISWVKMGPRPRGGGVRLSNRPHRISLSVFDGERDGRAEKGLALRAWRIDLQLEDFKPDEEVTDFILAPRVIDLTAASWTRPSPRVDDLPNWQDEWKFSTASPKLSRSPSTWSR